MALLVLLVGSVLLTFGISRLRRVKRALSSAEATERWVGLRAEVEFFEKVYGKTGAASGVLIFVSLLERRTMILADAPIFAKLPKESFDKTLAALNARIADNALAEGLVEAVEAIAPLLAREFPIRPGDRNEISDQIVLKDD
jgi:putative membrane protein